MAKNKSQDWQNPSVSFNNPFAGLRPKETLASDASATDDAVKKSEAAQAAAVSKAQGNAAPADAPEALDGQAKPQALRLKFARLERAKRGGKQVTVVGFVQSDEASRIAWLKDVQKRFGIGGSLEDEHAILQGDQRERLNKVFKTPEKKKSTNK